MGLLILVGSPLIMVMYILGIFYTPILVLQLTALVAVLGVLGLFAWIGYTMFTEPSSPNVVNASELDDLRAETLNPKSENGTQRKLKFSEIVDVDIGEGTIVRDHVNLYKCKIGNNCKIESFVYIEEGVVIGDYCKVKPHVFIPSGVTIGNRVFVGPNVTFTNDKQPRAGGEWQLLKTKVEDDASIGANSVIVPGLRIGKSAMIGAGSVVTSDVPDNTTVCGNPARPLVK